MEYKKVKLGEVCKVNQGLQIPISKRFKEKGTNRYFYITIQFLKGNTEEYYIENPPRSVICTKEDILVVRTGSTGIVLTNVEGCFHNNFFKVVPNNNIYSKYLYYSLNNSKMYRKMLNAASGTTIPDLKHSAFYDLEIYLPSIEIQKKIANILDNISKKIELNNQINDNLLKLNTELYEEYFINNLEKNAETVELKNLITVVNGYSYKGNELVEKSNMGMATIKNFERKGGFKEEGFKALKPSKVKVEQIVETNDILVACTDLTQKADIIGNAILLLEKAEFEKIVISMDLVKIIPKEGINKFIVYSILNSKEFKNFALGYKSGTTVLHLNKKCFNDFKVKLPNKDVLKKISIIVENNFKKISNILKENRRLEKLRDTLLPKLMNGEIDLDKIEI